MSAGRVPAIRRPEGEAEVIAQPRLRRAERREQILAAATRAFARAGFTGPAPLTVRMSNQTGAWFDGPCRLGLRAW
jgi:hypothetical protein